MINDGKKLVALSKVRPLTCHMYPFFKTTIKNFLNARMMYVKHCGGWISCSFALRPLLWQVSLFLFYKLTNSKKNYSCAPHKQIPCLFIYTKQGKKVNNYLNLHWQLFTMVLGGNVQYMAWPKLRIRPLQ